MFFKLEYFGPSWMILWNCGASLLFQFWAFYSLPNFSLQLLFFWRDIFTFNRYLKCKYWFRLNKKDRNCSTIFGKWVRKHFKKNIFICSCSTTNETSKYIYLAFNVIYKGRKEVMKVSNTFSKVIIVRSIFYPKTFSHSTKINVFEVWFQIVSYCYLIVLCSCILNVLKGWFWD
jgi:hypothetical protein